MPQDTVEEHFVAEVLRRTPPQLSAVIAEKVAARLAAAPAFNARDSGCSSTRCRRR